MMIKMELNNSSSDLMEEIEKKGNEKEEEEEEEEDTTFHVLAVDDSLTDRKLLEKLLTLSSYQVTCVESGDKALEYLGLIHSNNNTEISDCISSSSSKQELQRSKVNLIMTDYSMPGMSGYDLLKIVKRSSWKDVPVVVMSSENVPSRINMCLEGGAKEFLLKPLKLSDLKKLQPQLLVSSSSHSHQEADDDEEESEKIDEIPTNFDDEINNSSNNNNNNNNNSSNNNNNNNNNNNESSVNLGINMRKKIISPDLSELRPKLVNDIVVS